MSKGKFMRTILAFCLCMGLFSRVKPACGADLERIAGDYNSLGFQLLTQCRQSLPKPNYFLSPAGLAFALSMVQNGAQGETLRQIMATLQVSNMTLSQVNENNKALVDHL